MGFKGHSVRISGLKCRFAILSIRRLSPRKWHFTNHVEEISEEPKAKAYIQSLLEKIPKDAPIAVVICSALSSPAEVAHGLLLEQEKMVDEGKIDPHALKAGEISWMESA